MKQWTFFLLLLVAVAGCKKENNNDGAAVRVMDNFEAGDNGWMAGFAEYTVSNEAGFELQSGIRNLPAPLDQNKKGYFISGTNLSDNLFMFLKKKITGLAPNTPYEARFKIHLASNAPSNAVGIGGAPGESVFLGIGVINKEPIATAESGFMEMNIDKGNQATGGSARKVIGNIANGRSINNNEYVLLQKEGNFTFTSSSDGTVWAMVSTDSGFEGNTALYYDAIEIAIYRP